MAQTKPKAGQFYGVSNNGTDGEFLQTDGTGGMAWASTITNPTITSIDYPGSATAADPAGGESVIINGTLFASGITCTVGGTSAVTAFNSATQITITTPAKAAGPYTVAVTNTNGGTASENNFIQYSGVPVWSTAAGTLGNVMEGAAASFQVTATEGSDTIEYAVTTGTLPTGLSLATATGAITGTAPAVSADTTTTFSITATDDENQTSSERSFSITVQNDAPSNHFNTVIYTGTSSTQAVTGTAFEPDFVWIKDRTDANSHILQDSVRGANKALLSNATSAEITSTDFFTSFDSNGFTLPSNTGQQTNKLNNNYVSWNWKAPLANLSTGFNGSSSEIVAANSILPSSGGFAISWWQKTTQADNTYSYTIDTGGGSLGNGIYIITHNVSTGLIIGFKNGSTFGSSSIPYTSSERKQWTHFCFSWDGTTSTDAFKIYKNNVATSFTSTVTNGGSAYPFRIGRSYNGTDWFGGSIGQVRIYSSALSASEVSDLYAEPAASNNTLNYPAGAGCIAAYPLQTDAVDLSGNYNGASSNVTFGQPGYLTGNTNGTIPSTVAANVDAGFSITKYTGNGTSGATFAHGLGKQVEISIVKNVGSSGYWYVYSNLLPTNNNLYLNTSDSKQADGVMLGGNSTTVSISASSAVNTNNGSYIAYNFTSIPGYSRVGSYVGTGASGNFIYTGFQTSFVMIKRTDSAGNWLIFDSGRGAQYELYANLSDSEYNAGGGSNSFSATGFTPQTAGAWNLNGATYIYLAIA